MWGFECAQLRRRNDERLWNRCHEEDARLIRRIRGKLSTPRINPFEQEVIVQDLLDRAQEARERQSTLEQELGVSAEDFCRAALDASQHTGGGARALGMARRLLLGLALLLAPCALYWLANYDMMQWAEAYTGQSWGLRGRWVLLLPLGSLGMFAAFLVLSELWGQLSSARLARYRHGQWVSILGYVGLYVGMLLLPGQDSGPQVPIDLRVAAPVYAAALMAVCIACAWRAHRLSLPLSWRKKG